MSNYLSTPTTLFNEASGGDTENRDAIAGRSAAVENYPVLDASRSATFAGNSGNSRFSGTDNDYFVIDLNNDGVGSVTPGSELKFTVSNTDSNANFSIQWRLVDDSYLQTTGPYGLHQFYLQYSSHGDPVDDGSSVYFDVPTTTDSGGPIPQHAYLAFQVVDYNNTASSYSIGISNVGGLGGGGTTSTAKAAHDFNGDHSSDVLFRNNATGDTGWSDLHNGNVWHGLGASSTAYIVVGTADFSGDGSSDVLFRNNATGDTGYSDLHNGNVWHGLGASSTAYSVVGTADFNGDGYADVLFRNNATGDTGYSDLHSGSIWHGLGASSTAYSVVGTGDFNGDGYSDVLFRNNATGDTGYSDLHNGNAWHGLGASSTAYTVAAVGDYNGDGFSDVLFHNASTGDTGYSDLHNGNVWHGLGAASTDYLVVA